jgi:hypothetical protein
MKRRMKRRKSPDFTNHLGRTVLPSTFFDVSVGGVIRRKDADGQKVSIEGA